ncbi:MAG: InlB B-repeat-containing protein, partial [Clostridia bacterium]|nr:InlB B-repeat-containing protein [Clostridia bacterium]
VQRDFILYAGWAANKYTLVFDKGDENATGNVADVLAEYDKTVSLPVCTFVLPNYRFAGWKYGEDIYQAGDDVTNLSSKDGDVLTLTATWEKIKRYTLSFEQGRTDAQGTPPSSVVLEFGQSYILPTPSFTHQDWKTVGWQIKDSDETYSFGESVRDLTQEDGGEVVLVAVWEKIKRYTLSFESDQSETVGTLPSPIVVEIGKEYVLPTPAITCKGWNLICWQVKGGGATYSFGESVRDLTQEDGGQVTLVAVWERKTWPIMFSFNSEETLNRNQTITYGDTLTLPTESECKKTGYSFVGWEWNGTVYSAGESIENFYTEMPWAEFKAVWQGKTYLVKYVVITNATTSEFVVEETQFTYGTGYTWATEIEGFYKEGYKISSWHWKTKDVYFTAGELASPLEENVAVELYAVLASVTFSVVILDVNGEDLRSMSMQYGQDLTFENCLGIVVDGYYYAESAKILNADKTEYTGDPRYACSKEGGVVYIQPDWQEKKYGILLQMQWLDANGEEHTAYVNENGEIKETTTWIYLEYSQEFAFPTPTVEGHSFYGWEYYAWTNWDTVLGVYQGGETICKFTENVGFDPIPPVAKFVAKLTPNTYVVRYDGNGAGLGSMADVSGSYGQPFTFAENSYIKSGCTFGGWLLGETLYFKGETTYFVPAYDGEVILLKARWISYEGVGTQEQPYLISTYEDLFNLSIFMKEKPSVRSAYYRMTADIDCQGKILYAIDAYTENTFTNGDFTGVFDGNGYVIKNALFVKTESSQTSKGLFGSVRGGTIKNLGVIDYTTDENGCVYTAPLVAAMHGGTIENCYTQGTISGPVGGYMGGMIARMTSGTVKNCKSSGTLSVCYDVNSATVASYYIGGFTGSVNGGYAYVAAKLEHCYTDMDIILTAGEYNQIPRFYVGGFTGDVYSVAFTKCIATGNLSMGLVKVETDGATFHGKFNGGLRWADGSLSG